MPRIFAAALLACLASQAFATGDRLPPTSWQGTPQVDSEGIPVESFPAIEPQQLRERDAEPTRLGEPLQFAEPYDASASLNSHGSWDELPGGDRIWRLEVTVPGATDIGVAFSTFRLPKGARVHVYDSDRTFFQGGWGHEQNAPHGEFWAPIVPGDSAVIELFLPAGAPEPNLALGQVTGGYRDFFGRSGGPYMNRQGSCNNDVVCPEGDPWRDEIRSVGVYTLNGIWTCTGTLVNDVPNSLTPYFLTANHCGISSTNDQSMVVYWNFESPSCGDLGGGSLDDNQSGAILRASRSDVDMALVELEQQPAEAFNVHYAGWDRSNSQPGGAVAIHHPNTDEKAISFAESDLATTPSCIGGGGTPDTHWEVPFWDDGTTEPGSSGSGIWHPQDKRLVGFLSGGLAACGNQQYDCYGKFAVAWDGASASSRLRDWLDPDNEAPLGIDGSDPGGWSFDLSSTTLAQCGFDDLQFDIDLAAAGTFAEPVSLSASQLPAGVTADFSPNPVTAPDTSSLTLSGLDAAGAGSFAFQVTGDGGGISNDVELSVALADSTPDAVVNLEPSNGAVNVPVSPTITWDAAGQAIEYDIEIATDVAFSDVIHSATVASTTHTPAVALDTSTTYYLRVRAASQCGPGPWSETIAFTTESGPGDCPLGTESETVLAEDFESTLLPAGWSTEGSTGTATWSPSESQAYDGSRSIFAESVSGSSDQRLASPSFDLPAGAAAAFLTFRNWQDIEASGDRCFDGGLLEISTDGGTNWTPVPESSIQTRAYDGEIASGYDNPIEGESAWCGDPRDFWERYAIDLSAWTGSSVRLRFRFGSNSLIRQTGWYLDDLEVTSCSLPSQVFEDDFEDTAEP